MNNPTTDYQKIISRLYITVHRNITSATKLKFLLLVEELYSE